MEEVIRTGAGRWGGCSELLQALTQPPDGCVPFVPILTFLPHPLSGFQRPCGRSLQGPPNGPGRSRSGVVWVLPEAVVQPLPQLPKLPCIPLPKERPDYGDSREMCPRANAVQNRKNRS